MKENTLEKQVEYKLSDVITIFINMILENGIDNFLDDMDFCIYTIDFVEEASDNTICYLDDDPDVDDDDQEIYTDFKKHTDYRRQKHNRKKQEREQQENQIKKQSFYEFLHTDWKLLLWCSVSILLYIGIVVFFTIKTETPLLIMASWWMLYGCMCSYSHDLKPKLFKWLIMIPILEFIIFAVTFSCMFIPDWIDNERGWLIICTLFDSMINGALYFGIRFSKYECKEKQNRKRKK